MIWLAKKCYIFNLFRFLQFELQFLKHSEIVYSTKNNFLGYETNVLKSKQFNHTF